MLSELLLSAAWRCPDAPALKYHGDSQTYGALAIEVERFADGLIAVGLGKGDRVGIYLAKQFETVAAIFGTAAAGGMFVPLNPALRHRQVGYILRDCNIRILVTSPERLASLGGELHNYPDLRTVVLVGAGEAPTSLLGIECHRWDDLKAREGGPCWPRLIDSDLAAILYTSGSTGMPKGVVLSHRNLVAGARSVCQYLGNTAADRILAAPPLSFDYGLSQLTTGFCAGAEVVLMNYLFPRDVIRLLASESITGLPCVPPVWFQLAQLDWPAEATAHLRYATSTGGRMPGKLIQALQSRMPATDFFIMYGLTEAFRSTYLPPREVNDRPGSIGKAIPNAEVLVVRENGELCDPGEEGELVHRGPLVSLGYWNDPERSAKRFKPAPGGPAEVPIKEMAVWSGDTVRMDADGYLYFVNRRDDMIKTSGYRVSPTEVEDVIQASGLAGEVVAVGAPHARLGEGIVVFLVPARDEGCNADAIMAICRAELPNYMVPQAILSRESLPLNPNGKVDRRSLAEEVETVFEEAT